MDRYFVTAARRTEMEGKWEGTIGEAPTDRFNPFSGDARGSTLEPCTLEKETRGHGQGD